MRRRAPGKVYRSVRMSSERAKKRIEKMFEGGGRVVVVFREKHADPKHACLSAEEMERLCLAAVWERYHQGYFAVETSEVQRPPLEREAVEALPDGDTKRAAQREWKQYDSALGWRREEKAQREMAETAMRERDGALAFLLLEARSDYEYEGFEVEVTRPVEELPPDPLGTAPSWV